MDLSELKVYRAAMDIGERVWTVVEPWQWFAKNTVGRQWVRAGDSMAANLSEGYGRFFYKENRQFTRRNRTPATNDETEDAKRSRTKCSHNQ